MNFKCSFYKIKKKKGRENVIMLNYQQSVSRYEYLLNHNDEDEDSVVRKLIFLINFI